jgi:hypothetical protein
MYPQGNFLSAWLLSAVILRKNNQVMLPRIKAASAALRHGHSIA